MSIKPIETVYKNYKFRSRLEARWAVFFDALGIKYQYETEGFELGDGVRYLPDFWLPGLNYWIEIKGQDPTEQELQKVYKLAAQERNPVMVFGGECWYETKSYAFSPVTRDEPLVFKVLLAMAENERAHTFTFSESYPLVGNWLSETEYRYRDRDETEVDSDFYTIRRGFNLKDMVFWSCFANWHECPTCKRVWVAHILDKSCCSNALFERTVSSRLMGAYTAARQARFEHGASGA